jgi:hypothetical protein
MPFANDSLTVYRGTPKISPLLPKQIFFSNLTPNTPLQREMWFSSRGFQVSGIFPPESPVFSAAVSDVMYPSFLTCVRTHGNTGVFPRSKVHSVASRL